ncbi:MAG: translesion error-prone DNA polymerase V autoproteolytic subunit [Bacteroidota bacterium]
MKLAILHTSDVIDFYSVNTETELKLTVVESGISAGFPSPADDFLDNSIDLNKELIKNPNATFYGRVKGDSMKDAGIHHGDLLIIDKSLRPMDGKIAVCYIDGEFTVKKIKIGKDCCWLIAANENYPPIRVTAENDFIIWGIVVHVVKNF